MNARTRALVRLSAELGAGRLDGLGKALAEASREAGRSAVEETLLQAYLFVGFPTVLHAFGEWRSQVPAASDADPIAEAAQEDSNLATWRRRGEALCRRVYGPAYGKLRSNVRRLHPELDRWMLEEGYGKVLARPGLDPVDRELCIVGLLSAAGHGPQLHSHLRGALRLGASPADVEAAVELGASLARSGRAAEAARALWRRVRTRAGSAG